MFYFNLHEIYKRQKKYLSETSKLISFKVGQTEFLIKYKIGVRYKSVYTW